MFEIQVFVLLFLTNIFYCESDDLTFIKNDCNFERIVQNETIILENSPLKTIPDYVYLTQTLLDRIKNGYPVSMESLNKFNLGIHQYYLSLSYEKLYTKAVSHIRAIEFHDPISLPNATALGEPNLFFYGARVFGFPGFMRNYDLFGEPGRDSYLQHFKIDFLSKSDVVIFTGYFSVFRCDYFFVYHLNKNILKSSHIKLRSNDGTIVTKKIKDYLSFSAERLIHTYDSSYDKYDLVNATLTAKLTAIIEQIWLPKLISMTYERLVHRMTAENVKFANLYRQKVIYCLMETFHHYMNLKNISSFTANPVNYTLQSGKRTFFQVYEDIKVEGLLNHAKYELSESKVEDQEHNLHMSDTITITYEDTPTHVTFNVGDNRRKMVNKTFKIAKISVTANYYVNLEKLPLKLFKNDNATINESGFLVSFELDNFDPVYTFLINHVGNDMARAIDVLLQNEMDLFKIDEF